MRIPGVENPMWLGGREIYGEKGPYPGSEISNHLQISVTGKEIINCKSEWHFSAKPIPQMGVFPEHI